jgi:hypothetical protein
MARYNPFFEHGGLHRVAESTPDRYVLQAIAKLNEIGFDPTFLSSEAYNLHKLRNNHILIGKVKDVLREFSKRGGIYRKRLASAKPAFLGKEEFDRILENADEEKLAKMLRILSFLAQPKVYLFWKNEPALSFIQFLHENPS